MVLTRRAAKQLEEQEKKRTLVDGCQDAKIAVEHDAENVQPQKQSKVITKAKTADSRRKSLAPVENEQILEEPKESPKRDFHVPASPLQLEDEIPASPSTLQNNYQNLDETKDGVIDHCEDLFVSGVTKEEDKQAIAEAQGKLEGVSSQNTTLSPPPVPAFIAALDQKGVDCKESIKDVNPTDKEAQIVDAFTDEETKSAYSSPPSKKVETNPTTKFSKSSPLAEQPGNKAQEDAYSPESKEDDMKLKKNNKQKHQKDKSFNALHGTRKDHGASTKHRAPAPHHQDIVHPAPADLVEAVQMSADSLQAQLNALTLGPSTRNNQFSSSAAATGTPYFQRNPESTASVMKNLAALSSQLHRLTLCVGTLQQEIAAAAIPEIPDAVGRHFLALDTCALMHRHSDLDVLIDTLIRQAYNPSISDRVSVLVPLETVRELDYLKESRDDEKRRAARKAISLLGELQKASNTIRNNNENSANSLNNVLLYRGQRQKELPGPYARRGDDGILDCMVLFKNAGAVEINLVTQDNNFALRAQTEGFKALNVVQALVFVTRLNPPSYREKAAVPVKILPLPKSASYVLQVKMNRVAPPPPPPKTLPLPASKFSNENNDKGNVAVQAPLPPPSLPPSPTVEHTEEEFKTPNAKLPPSPPRSGTVRTPIFWTPFPPPESPAPIPAVVSTITAEAPTAAATTSAAAAPVVVKPSSIKNWKTVNGELVRPPGTTSKQWSRYRYFYRLKLKKQNSNLQSRRN